MEKVYLVTGIREVDGQGVCAEREKEDTIRVYKDKENAERVMNFLNKYIYSNYDYFEVKEEKVR